MRGAISRRATILICSASLRPGRFFHHSDDVVPGASPYAVLSYDYWRTRFGGSPSVVGSTIRINRLPYTVLGVAPAGFNGTKIFYRPHTWVPMSMQAQIEVGNPWFDPSMPLFGVRAVEEMLGFVLLPMRVAATALGAFGILAVMLVATGIHGVVSYAAARRRREIAIRVAVGATRRSILQLVLRRIAILVAAGALLGLPLAVATGGFLGSIVYRGSVNDLTTSQALP